MNKLKLLDLFSGIGGFSLGFEKTGSFETIAFCEKDKFCQSVLAKHWNNIKIYDEIRNLKGIKAEVITAGFPCQPFSVAGKRKGRDDDRYLWNETLKVIAETKPRWFVGENVEGIVNISEGKVLQQIQKDLEAESFQVQCLIIPASGVGAWHQRKRVWIIGYSEHNGSFTSEIKRRNSEVDERSSQRKNETLQSERTNGSSNDGNVSNSNSQRQQKQCRSKPISESRNKFECSSWWEAQSELCGVPHGISKGLVKDRVNRIKALGNSIVPEIAYEIAKAILVAENEQTNGQVQRHRGNQHGIK